MPCGIDALAETPGNALQWANGEAVSGWDPSVIYDESVGAFRAWYTWWDGATQVLGIAHAESGDGLTWVERGPTHVITPTPGGWDSKGMETVSVLLHEGQYYMWYLGYPCSLPEGSIGREKCIGLAMSSDGVTWEKEEDPVLEPTESWEGPYSRVVEEEGEIVTVWDGGVQEPTVRYNDDLGRFEMWYAAYNWEELTEDGREFSAKVDRIGFATSTDGKTWVKENGGQPVLVGESETWEGWNGVTQPGVFVDEAGEIHLFYHSFHSIGHATSSDGLTWVKDPDNPVLASSDDTGGSVNFFGGPSPILRAGRVDVFLMRTKPTATAWGEDGMDLTVASTSCSQD